MEKKSGRGKTKNLTPVPKKLSQEVTFETFFAKCVTDGKLKPWQHDEVAAFFKDMRLREKEDFEVYQTMLKRY